ncbi:MAG TPA: YqjK family protein [Ottowia sp.]|nr:YqjK family protein [Ottowia sp.]
MTDGASHTRPRELAARREHLLLRSAQLREQIGARTQVLRPAFRAVDRVRGGARAVRQRRGWVLLGAAALAGAALVRPRLVMGLGARAWAGWQTYRRVQPIARTLLRQLM